MPPAQPLLGPIQRHINCRVCRCCCCSCCGKGAVAASALGAVRRVDIAVLLEKAAAHGVQTSAGASRAAGIPRINQRPLQQAHSRPHSHITRGPQAAACLLTRAASTAEGSGRKRAGRHTRAAHPLGDAAAQHRSAAVAPTALSHLILVMHHALQCPLSFQQAGLWAQLHSSCEAAAVVGGADVSD